MVQSPHSFCYRQRKKFLLQQKAVINLLLELP